MGKELVQYACGHEEVVAIIGNAAWRKRQAKYLGRKLCPACIKLEQQKQNQEAAAQNAADGLPQLMGSEAQILWAEQIRFEMLEYAARMDEEWERYLETKNTDMLLATPHLQTLVQQVGEEKRLAFFQLWQGQKSASWWIEHRQDYPLVITDILQELRISAPATGQTAQILRPAGEPKSRLVIELSSASGFVWIRPPEKRHDFQTLMRKLECRWHSNVQRYAFQIREFDGEAVDLLAEMAVRLVDEGFMVSLSDETALQLALSGTYKPRKTRWVLLQGDMLVLRWSRDEDFYSEARIIPGCRYSKGRMIAPKTAVDAVCDWAEEYEFSITPEVQTLLTQQRQALAQSLALETKPKKMPQKCRQARPERLQVPEQVDALDSLKDD